MPYQGPDRYFVSNGNYDVFMDWINEIRAGLLVFPSQSNQNLYSRAILNTYLSLAEISRSNRSLANSGTSAQKAKAKRISTQNRNESIGRKILSDQLIKREQTQGQQVSGYLKKESEIKADNQKTITKIEREENADAALEKNKEGTAKVEREVLTFDKSTLDKNNPIESQDRDSPHTYDVYGVTDIHSTFPQLGQESAVGDVALAITNTVNNTLSFDVVSGYKPANDKTPADKEFKGWTVVKGNTKESDPKRTFTEKTPFSEYANSILDKIQDSGLPGSYKFFIEKLHGRYGDGSPYKLNSIKSQKTVKKINGDDQDLSNRMVFSAYIDNYFDNYTTSQTDYSFLGRGETVPIYKSTSRDITLQFTMLADYSTELMLGMSKLNQQLGRSGSKTEAEILEAIERNTGLDWGLGQISEPRIYKDGRVGSHIPGMYSDSPTGLWSKMTFLSQCMYPYYRDDGKMKEQPMCRLRIGDFYDCVVFVKNLQFEMTALGEGVQVDLNPSSIGNMPMGIKVTISGQVIHNYEPSSNFFGFYNRREYDEKTLNPVTGVGIDLQKPNPVLDDVKVDIKKDFKGLVGSKGNEKLLTSSSLDLDSKVTGLSAALSSWQQDYAQLEIEQNKPGFKLGDYVAKKKMVQAFKSFTAVNDVVNHLRILEGVPLVGQLNELRKGNFSQAITALGTDPLSKFKDLKEQGEELKGQFSQLKDKVKTAAGDLTEQGILKTALKEGKKALGSASPQTFADILNKIKNG